MSEAETHNEEAEAPEEPEEVEEEIEEVQEPESEEPEPEVEEESPELEEPDVYDFTQESGYTAGDLSPAYEEIGEDYELDEESETVLIGGSSWGEIEGLLSEDGSNSTWTDRVESYLFNKDKEFAVGGAAGIGTGLLSGVLGYTTAADFLFTGGVASLSWGIGSYIGKKVGDYFGDGSEDTEEEETEDIEHELDEYSDWEVEIVDEESYGQALKEYMESQSE